LTATAIRSCGQQSLLRIKLREASVAARDFAMSDEPLHEAQRQQYMALADSLEAQERSLRAEV
jgi:hypothetical protein